MAHHVIYARKSTESDDRQILSIDSQINELQALAARRGVRVAEVLTESRSAKAPGRPVFRDLMRRVRRGEIRGVFCWKMDRLSRNHLDTGTVLQALADGVLEEIVTSDRTYTRDGNDRFMGSFELGMATKYIDDLRQNIRCGIRARLQRGWIHYRAPIGYLNDPVSRTIKTDPKRFGLIRRMWELLLSGTVRPAEILETADEKWGLRTRRTKHTGGKPLSRTGLYDLFANPFYMGLIRLQNGDSYPGMHPPMVSREEFQRAQEILGRTGRRPQQHRFAFTGLIRCSGCAGSITAELHIKPSGRRYVYYRCSRSMKGVPCREPAISVRDLESQIVNRLRSLAMPQKVYEWLLVRLGHDLDREHDRRGDARRTLQAALEAVLKEEENLLSLRVRDLVEDSVYVAKRAEMADRRVALSEKLKQPGRSANELRQLSRDVVSLGTRAAETFVSGTGVQKRMILEAVGLNYALGARRVAFSLKKPFTFLADAGACSNWWSTADDIRTWLLDSTEYLMIPDLSKSASLDILPYEDDLGKEGLVTKNIA